jgi:hypothetical protein
MSQLIAAARTCGALTLALVASPLVIPAPDNALTFALAAGDWRRLDEGVNVVSDFAPGTHLLCTNGNNGFGLDGQGNGGGGGSGPAEIRFADGVRAIPTVLRYFEMSAACPEAQRLSIQ